MTLGLGRMTTPAEEYLAKQLTYITRQSNINGRMYVEMGDMMDCLFEFRMLLVEAEYRDVVRRLLRGVRNMVALTTEMGETAEALSVAATQYLEDGRT